MSLAHAILLGLVQGLTEFLPVSSSGHLVLFQHFLPGFSQPGLLFDVILHLGTMVAVVVVFRADLARLFAAPFNQSAAGAVDRRLLLLLISGSIPTAIIGLTFKDAIEGLFANVNLVALMLMLTGTLLFLAERFRRPGRKEGALTFSDAIVTGIAQGIAIIPGISRSGSTIAALLFKGVDGETAARFSFLLALPAVGGAALLSLKDLEALPAGELPVYLAGAGVAMLAGLCSIRFLLQIIRRQRLIYFALYCWCVGGVFFALTL
jgi:undecaprenyl-diphosphatase